MGAAGRCAGHLQRLQMCQLLLSLRVTIRVEQPRNRGKDQDETGPWGRGMLLGPQHVTPGPPWGLGTGAEGPGLGEARG